MRKELKKFANEMEAVLKANDYKGTWHELPVTYLNGMLSKKRKELNAAIRISNKQAIMHQCLDVANFCMMLYDNARAELEHEER